MNYDELKDWFSYDPPTGIVRWAKSPSYKMRAGDIAGTRMKRGYIYIILRGKGYLAHRLAWLLMTKSWPKNYIDHIDNNQTNNNWENLREATAAQNQWNSKISKTNTSGIKGVRYRKKNKKWLAQIVKNGQNYGLGTFKTKEAAKQAYESAAKRLHGDFVRFE